MIGDSPLFEQKPTIFVDPNKKIIRITGHYPDEVRCAKLTMLCEKYGATVLKDGYAEVPYSEAFLDDLKYINPNKHFVMGWDDALWIALILGATALFGGTAIQNENQDASIKKNKSLAESLRKSHPELTQAQIEALVSQYGDDGFNLFNPTTWADRTDQQGLYNMLTDLDKAYEDLGEMPAQLSLEELATIENQARAEIDAENRQILDLYDQVSNNNNNLLQQQFDENSQMFADYRNQALTNNAMQQQAIAGSTRYELERAQRNAIVRGASAAQRLVANINTQLGMQSKSAQQALETSNVLAQQLLAHRQAQNGLRQDYMNNMNQDMMRRADLLRGGAERKLSYSQAQMDHALNRNQYARDAWNNRVNDYFQGNSLGEGIYRNRYGNAANRSNNNNSY